MPVHQVIAVHDWRRETLGKDFMGEYRELARNFTNRNEKQFNFLIVDMGNRKMFEYLADTYGIGNFESPGIFATHGFRFYYRNYQRYEGPESFQRIGWDFLNDLENETKKPMSNRAIRDFFSVNLLNFEYHINFPLKTFLLFNGFLGAMIIPLLMVDTCIQPILGYGPAQ